MLTFWGVFGPNTVNGTSTVAPRPSKPNRAGFLSASPGRTNNHSRPFRRGEQILDLG